MPKRARRRSVPRVTPATLAKLRRDLERCTEKVEHLEDEISINIRRMASMQAEIDDLRSRLARR